MKKVSIDAGALSSDRSERFGNFVFTRELIKALKRYDQKNSYTIYLQKPVSSIPEMENSIPEMEKMGVVLRPRFAWLKGRVSFCELIKPNDVFLALNQALPWWCPGRKIVFCHGLAPLIYPKLYPDSQKRMRQQIMEMLDKANYIVVGSQKLADSLNDINREEKRTANIKVINYGIPTPFLDKNAVGKRKRFILSVSSSHPIKNHRLIVSAFAKLIQTSSFKSYKLILIGTKKIDYIPQKLLSQVIVIPHAEHYQLLSYYQKAACLLTTSKYESFNLPVLEALSQNTQVVGTKGAIIPELTPFVNLAPEDSTGLATSIASAIKKPKAIHLGKLRTKFSWQRYVKKLTTLYE
jgi:glycosyltransferase involved in cell wall biosynthesis